MVNLGLDIESHLASFKSFRRLAYRNADMAEPWMEEACRLRGSELARADRLRGLSVRVADRVRVFELSTGFVGLVPLAMEAGDIACVLYGYGMPVILRPANDHYRCVLYRGPEKRGWLKVDRRARGGCGAVRAAVSRTSPRSSSVTISLFGHLRTTMSRSFRLGVQKRRLRQRA
ncbi:hypothetical protein B0T26DRAFT_496366 [Lasiosphaeria miniovina]|uniref:Uncharacterized protein n=1 Tax=Lasiosphaeria miniovina TaxID=1954250 RepID=A0AA40DKQ0_9PEZI|nr:uncharacterized protein B0T26DRAFT_496366 [Lasiosphaeria miniovina]KAK0703383.1 hypothetical protein B0T26DRAFT_496366 [Lasiosphaeria miniovina]